MPVRPARLPRPLVAAAALALFASAGTARAGMITTANIADSELPGLFTGSVAYNWTGSTQVTLTISLADVSPTGNGGSVTAALNDSTGAGVSLAPGAASFSLVGNVASNEQSAWNGLSYGNIDPAGANGAPTGTFVFAVTGTGLDLFGAPECPSVSGTDGPFRTLQGPQQRSER